MAKISVIVPVYNPGIYFKPAIDSILGQTYKDLEVILVDDGSTDGSSEACDELAARDTRVVVIHQENQGLPEARNAGMAVMGGEYVSFVDADDSLDPQAYEHCLPYMRDNTDVILFDIALEFGEIRQPLQLHEAAFTVSAAEQELRDCLVLGTIDEMPHGQYDFRKAMLGTACNKLLRTGFLRENDISFTAGIRRCEDLLFSVEVLLKAQSIQYTNRVLYFYRQVEGSMVHRYIPNILEISKGYLTGLNALVEDKTRVDQAYHKAYVQRCRKALFECYELGVYHKNNPASYKERVRQAQAVKGQSMFSSALEEYTYSFSSTQIPSTMRIWCIRHSAWRLYPLAEKFTDAVKSMKRKKQAKGVLDA